MWGFQSISNELRTSVNPRKNTSLHSRGQCPLCGFREYLNFFVVWFLSSTSFFWHVLLASAHKELPGKQIRLLWSRNSFVWFLGHVLNTEQMTELSKLCGNTQSLNSWGTFFFKRCKVLNLQVEPFYVKIQWCWFLARTWKSWEKYQEQLLSKDRLVFEVGVNWQQGVSLWSWVFNSCYLVTMKTPARRKHCSLMGIQSPSLFHSLSQGISTVCPVLEHLCTAWKVPMFAV